MSWHLWFHLLQWNIEHTAKSQWCICSLKVQSSSLWRSLWATKFKLTFKWLKLEGCFMANGLLQHILDTWVSFAVRIQTNVGLFRDGVLIQALVQSQGNWGFAQTLEGHWCFLHVSLPWRTAVLSNLQNWDIKPAFMPSWKIRAEFSSWNKSPVIVGFFSWCPV